MIFHCDERIFRTSLCRVFTVIQDTFARDLDDRYRFPCRFKESQVHIAGFGYRIQAAHKYDIILCLYLFGQSSCFGYDSFRCRLSNLYHFGYRCCRLLIRCRCLCSCRSSVCGATACQHAYTQNCCQFQCVLLHNFFPPFVADLYPCLCFPYYETHYKTRSASKVQAFDIFF